MFKLSLFQELVALTGIGKKRSHCVVIYQVSVYVILFTTNSKILWDLV